MSSQLRLVRATTDGDSSIALACEIGNFAESKNLQKRIQNLQAWMSVATQERSTAPNCWMVMIQGHFGRMSSTFVRENLAMLC